MVDTAAFPQLIVRAIVDFGMDLFWGRDLQLSYMSGPVHAANLSKLYHLQ